MFSLISEAPVWVWPLLVALVVYGFIATRDRETSVIPVYLLPLMGLLTLRAVIDMSAGLPVWIGYGVAYVVATFVGYRLQHRWVLVKKGLRVILRGEWLTFLVVMVLFWSNYAWNAATAISPDSVATMPVQMAFGIVAGLASGSLFGRAMNILLRKSGYL